MILNVIRVPFFIRQLIKIDANIHFFIAFESPKPKCILDELIMNATVITTLSCGLHTRLFINNSWLSISLSRLANGFACNENHYTFELCIFYV